MADPYKILLYPLRTEKAVREIEATNTLVFIVNKVANKQQITWAVQKAFDVKVIEVRTAIMPDGKKKAYIKLSEETPAIEVTSKLGLV